MLLHISFKSVICFLMAISPASTRDKSRISLIRASTRPLLLSIISMNFMRSSGESVSAIIREKPSIAFRGVRISWLMLARNRDFILLAFSAFCAIVSYSANFLRASSSSTSTACFFALASANFCSRTSRSSRFIMLSVYKSLQRYYKKFTYEKFLRIFLSSFGFFPCSTSTMTIQIRHASEDVHIHK